MFTQQFENDSTLPARPLFKLTLRLKGKDKGKDKSKDKSKGSKNERWSRNLSREEKTEYRAKCRAKIHNYSDEGVLDAIIRDIVLMSQEECDIDVIPYLLSVKNRKVTRHLLSFFDISQTTLEFSPSLDVIEEKLKDLLLMPIPECYNIKQIYHSQIQTFKSFATPDLLAEILDFRNEFDNFLLSSFMPMYATAAVLMQFDFLSQMKHYDKDLKEDFEARVHLILLRLM